MSSKTIALTLLVSFAWVVSTTTSLLHTRINTQEIYRTPSIPSNKIYSIQVKRVDSTKAEEVSRCWSVPRSITVVHKDQLFRLSKDNDRSREQKVYQKLTSLSQQENIIEQFQIIGDNLFVVTTDGLGYFIPIANPQQVHKVATNLISEQSNITLGSIAIKQYKERALIITPNKFMLCKYEKTECEVVKGYDTVTKFRGAQIFEENGRFMVFIITADEIISYEFAANGELKNQQKYDNSFFGTKRMSFRAIVRGEGSSIYVLDDIEGVWEMVGKEGISKGFVPNEKIIFNQFGCYRMIAENQAQSLVLACNPSANNFFVMNLVKSTQFTKATYEPLETVFMQEKLYQISSAENILMGRVYSGVKLFWSSKQVGNPYPYFYRNAGSVFLHNAIQSKLRVIDQRKTIFLAAEDELLKYELRSFDPYVACYSPIELNEQYKLVYEIQCPEDSKFMGKQNVCTKEELLNFETWEHKEMKVGTHIFPFIISLFGVIAIGCIIKKIHKQYNAEVEEAKQKYNIENDQLSV